MLKIDRSALVAVLSALVLGGAQISSASAQDRGFGLPDGSQDASLPNTSQIGGKSAQEVAEESFKEGLQAMMDGDYSKCDEKFEVVTDMAPSSPEANYYRGVCKSRLGDENAAIPLFERAVTENPDFIQAREQLALTNQNVGRSDQARSQLNELQAIKQSCGESDCSDAFNQQLDRSIANVQAAVGAT